MKAAIALPSRQIHLDFHTGPAVPDVGVDFDAKAFAQTMKRANVNSVTVFAKCHHGHLYYNTKRPERHPGLKKGYDLLARQVEAMHREGIRAPIYISVQCDEYAANTYPQWVARNPDSTQVKWAWGKADKVFGAGWQILDMATDYQEFLAEQTAEVLKLFKPVDGLFFDMCWDQQSTTAPFIAQMIKANLNPELEADRKTYSRKLAHAYMKRFGDMVAAASPAGTCYFNGRKYPDLADEYKFLSQVEIEALPTGGWGYMYFPKNVRFARTFDRPYMGMTARFHKSWADFGGLKPYAALEYETSQMMAHGAKCSIGDQLHPRGTLDNAVYDLIGQVYGRYAEREPWLEDAKPLTQIGLFPAGGSDHHGLGGVDEGATRLLTQLKHQFDVVHAAGNWSKYDLLILPDAIKVDAALSKKLSAYLKRGGAILATGFSGLTEDATATTFKELAITPAGKSPFTVTYLRFGEIGEGVPVTDHVMYESGVRVKPLKGTTGFGQIVEPYFERAWDHFCSHNQTPGSKATQFPIATLKGRVGYIPFPIFSAFAKHGNYPCRLLVRNLIDRLLPSPLLRVEAPTSTEATVMRQMNRTIVHLLQYCPERRTDKLDIVEDIVPLYDVPMSLKLAKKPKRVYSVPDEEEIPFDFADGRVNLLVPEVSGHAMICFE